MDSLIERKVLGNWLLFLFIMFYMRFVMNDDHCTYVSYLNFVKGLSFDDLLILAKRLVMLNASMVRNR